MSFYGIFASSIIICTIMFAFAMSQNVQLQGSLTSAYTILSANMRIQSLGEIISNSQGNFSIQNIAQLNGANLSCASGQCTIKTPYGYLLVDMQ